LIHAAAAHTNAFVWLQNEGGAGTAPASRTAGPPSGCSIPDNSCALHDFLSCVPEGGSYYSKKCTISAFDWRGQLFAAELTSRWRNGQEAAIAGSAAGSLLSPGFSCGKAEFLLMLFSRCSGPWLISKKKRPAGRLSFPINQPTHPPGALPCPLRAAVRYLTPSSTYRTPPDAGCARSGSPPPSSGRCSCR
jgi:hypothetical protein